MATSFSYEPIGSGTPTGSGGAFALGPTSTTYNAAGNDGVYSSRMDHMPVRLLKQAAYGSWRFLLAIWSSIAGAWNALWNSSDESYGNGDGGGCMSCLRPRILGVYVCGGLFAIAWWLFIDGLAVIQSAKVPTEWQPIFGDWLPGLGVSFSFFMINVISRPMLTGDFYGYADDSGVRWKVRLWFFVALALSMASLGGSVGMFAIRFSQSPESAPDEFKYFGTTIVAQSLIILLTSLIMWTVRNWNSEGSISI